MQSKTNEQALESAIEKRLTGVCREDLNLGNTAVDVVEDRRTHLRGGNGYFIGYPSDFNAKYVNNFDWYRDTLSFP